jgi:hypothetical protein
VRVAFVISRASDIEVEPWQVFLDELLEKETSNEHSTHTLADIG